MKKHLLEKFMASCYFSKIVMIIVRLIETDYTFMGWHDIQPYNWVIGINGCNWNSTYKFVVLIILEFSSPSLICLLSGTSLQWTTYCYVDRYSVLYYFLTDPENSSFWRSWERNASIWTYRCGWHCTWNSRVPYHIWGTSLSVWYGMFVINLISAFPKTPTVPHLWQQKFWLATMEPSILFLDVLLQLDVQHEMILVIVQINTLAWHILSSEVWLSFVHCRQ
jgi:hypothetical protein